MSKYVSGRRAETELVEELLDLGYFAMRVFGSGRRFNRPVPDVIALSLKYDFFFQVKRTARKVEEIYINNDDVERLYECSNLAGAKAFIAAKFPHRKIRIAYPTDLRRTEKSYVFHKEDGVPITELQRVGSKKRGD